MNNRKKFKNNKGQSIFEVVIALAMISIILIALAALGAASIRASTFARNQTGATRYTQQALEWLNEEKATSWSIFLANAGSPTWCFDSLYWQKPRQCAASDIISGTIYTRWVDFKINSGAVQATVQTSWKDAQGVHTVPSSTIYTNTQ